MITVDNTVHPHPTPSLLSLCLQYICYLTQLHHTHSERISHILRLNMGVNTSSTLFLTLFYFLTFQNSLGQLTSEVSSRSMLGGNLFVTTADPSHLISDASPSVSEFSNDNAEEELWRVSRKCFAHALTFLHVKYTNASQCNLRHNIEPTFCFIERCHACH